MSRLYNFSAGPAILPEAVLAQAQQELMDWQGTGMSVMEMSHRGDAFMSIAAQAEADLREILAIPENYHVLFLQGGASLQFSMIPMNLLCGSRRMRADYIHTGAWSQKAIREAGQYCDVNIASSAEDRQFTYIPDQSTWQLRDDAAYVHYTPNETIGGVEFHFTPNVGDKPLVADMSSTLLSRPIDVSKFGLIYAGAQKNIGPAGLTLVIIREDLIGKPLPDTPTMLDYSTYAKSGSMYNTPPTYSWYLAGLVFQWIKQQGGLTAMAEINQRKAEKLYAAIDHHDFYNNPVAKTDRSWMNVPFMLADASQDKAFLQQAKVQGLSTLKGHRSVGGMRASIYNAMPESGVDALIEFMHSFATT